MVLLLVHTSQPASHPTALTSLSFMLYFCYFLHCSHRCCILEIEIVVNFAVVVDVEDMHKRSLLRSKSVSNVVIIDSNLCLRGSMKEKIEFAPTQPQLFLHFQ